LRAETGGRFQAQNAEKGRNSVRRPQHPSLTDRNCEGFCRPGNHRCLSGLDGGGRSPAKPVSREEKQSNPCSAPKICLFDENSSLFEFTPMGDFPVYREKTGELSLNLADARRFITL
jgi:hypothetical protein